MTVRDNLYPTLAEKFGCKGATSFYKVLESVLAPEEGELFLELARPATCRQLAERLNIDEKVLQAQLDEMETRGWIRQGEEGYFAPRMSPRFMPRIPRPDVSEEETEKAWDDFYWQDWRRILVEDKEKKLEKTGHNQWRFAPAGMGIAASPNIKPELLMPCEDVRAMVMRATDITVHECGCRSKYHNCDRPVETCLRVVFEGKVDTSDEHTGGHENQIHISGERAIEIMNEAEEAGLLHTLLNASILERTINICSCCPCCCYLLNPVIEQGKLHKLVSPSRFRAVIDEELCQGCQTCIERCHFDAIEMRKVPGSKKMKAFIIAENCMGCGICNFKCPHGAMRLEIARPPIHIPAIPMSHASSIPERFEEA